MNQHLPVGYQRLLLRRRPSPVGDLSFRKHLETFPLLVGKLLQRLGHLSPRIHGRQLHQQNREIPCLLANHSAPKPNALQSDKIPRSLKLRKSNKCEIYIVLTPLLTPLSLPLWQSQTIEIFLQGWRVHGTRGTSRPRHLQMLQNLNRVHIRK